MHAILAEPDLVGAVRVLGMGRIARSSSHLPGGLIPGIVPTWMLQLPNRHREQEQSRRQRQRSDQPEDKAAKLQVDEPSDQALND